MTKDEMLEVVDSDGNVLRLAARSEIHGNPSLVHRVVHVLVFDARGRLLLQKRSKNKDVAPGKWDTSVGGHVSPGEDTESAALREMREELGIQAVKLAFLYRYLFPNHIESELVTSYSCVYGGEIHFNREEIDEVRHWTIREIRETIGKGVFSNHFETEIRNYLE